MDIRLLPWTLLTVIVLLILVMWEPESVEGRHVECQSSKDCSGHGTCVWYRKKKLCRCGTNWKGSLCNTHVNQSLSLPNPGESECKLKQCGSNGQCVRIVVRGRWTDLCRCNEGFAGRHCEHTTNDCNFGDLVIAIHSRLLSGTNNTIQLRKLVEKYKQNNPRVRVTTVVFEGKSNHDGLMKIRDTLDQPSAWNDHGQKAGRMALLITGYDKLPKDDRRALEYLRKTKAINVSVMTTGNDNGLKPMVKEADRKYALKHVEMNELGSLDGLVQAMLCRTTYSRPKIINNVPSTSKCTNKNICFLIDSSQSVSESNFQKELQFVGDFISAESAKNQFATVRYGLMPKLISSQSDSTETHKDKLFLSKHERRFSLALSAFNLCFNGSRAGDKIIVLLSDGKLDYPKATATELNTLFLQEEISTLAVGISTKKDFVKHYVTGHFAGSEPMLTDWSKLNSRSTLTRIISILCPV